jgi:hypothetical protein
LLLGQGFTYRRVSHNQQQPTTYKQLYRVELNG